ncbi:MAG: DOPA 4,5-dioxygenase family protein [Alphaproteobacteria bacterium]|nr:DOPA 4,5-dioxygenase family protein [Alphaproteobacteria bacterium]
MPANPTEIIKAYHAHVYYDAQSVEAAKGLRTEIEETFDIEMGRFHEKNVGPHPRWSYQVAFGPEQFGTLVPWLSVNRGDLTVFVHACSGEHMIDHTAYVHWLGDSIPLDLDALR